MTLLNTSCMKGYCDKKKFGWRERFRDELNFHFLPSPPPAKEGGGDNMNSV